MLYPRKLVADSGKNTTECARNYNVMSFVGNRLSISSGCRGSRSFSWIRTTSPSVSAGESCGKLAQLRRKARATDGRGSGAEIAWKLTSNAMYGILGSGYLVTGNCVAANVITAHGRAVAFAMFQSLNGLQLATDGCTYRLDRIPRCTSPECLAAMPDYLLRHADDTAGIPFYDPAEIPQNDADFNAWFAGHVARFFGLEEASVRRLLVHQLEHKHTPGETGPIIRRASLRWRVQLREAYIGRR